MTVRIVYGAACASLVALIFLCLAWELWLASLRTGGSWLALNDRSHLLRELNRPEHRCSQSGAVGAGRMCLPRAGVIFFAIPTGLGGDHATHRDDP